MYLVYEKYIQKEVTQFFFFFYISTSQKLKQHWTFVTKNKMNDKRIRI